VPHDITRSESRTGVSGKEGQETGGGIDNGKVRNQEKLIQGLEDKSTPQKPRRPKKKGESAKNAKSHGKKQGKRRRGRGEQ